jgi:hypothetical protein
MDWLGKHKVLIDYARKSVKLTTPDRWYSEVVVWGKRLSWSGLGSSSVQRQQWWLVLGSASSSNVGLLFMPCSEKAKEEKKRKKERGWLGREKWVAQRKSG